MKVWLKLATCCALMLGAQAHAQNKNVTLVVPYPPGGAADQLARVISQEMGTRFDQKVIVENRPGAGAQVAMNVVKNANPSSLGTVLFLADSGAYSLNRHLYQRLNYDVATDLIPMTLAAKAPVFLLVNKDSPFKTVQDLVAAGQKQELTYGSPGMGTGTHLLGEMLRKETGARLVHVPYKGTGPALQDLLGGQVDLTFGTAPPFMAHIQAGKLKVLAVTGKERLPSLPKVPTTAETGFAGVNATSWFALFAPAKTPKDIVRKLETDVRNMLSDASFQKKALDQGATADFMDSKALGDMVKRDYAMWAKVVKEANIKAD